MNTQSHYPSLFLLLNVHDALWYRVKENNVEQLASYTDEKDTFEDHEGGFGRGSGEPDIMNAQKKEETEHNFKQIVERTAEIWEAHEFKLLTVAIHERFKNIFLNELNRGLHGVEPNFIFGNRTKAGKKEVLELFKESLKVV
ncbi:MAG: hypothetical protein ABII02_02480 [Candidatus Magasanikbacteria bacterium]